MTIVEIELVSLNFYSEGVAGDMLLREEKVLLDFGGRSCECKFSLVGKNRQRWISRSMLDKLYNLVSYFNFCKYMYSLVKALKSELRLNKTHRIRVRTVYYY